MIHLLAVAEIDPVVQTLFYAVAVVLLVLAALGVSVQRVSLQPLGLAAFVFVFMWQALAAT